MNPFQNLILSVALVLICFCRCSNGENAEKQSASIRQSLQNEPKPLAIPRIPSLAFDRFTTEQGLSSNIILCLFQDKLGFLWIGTENGLNRYDGHIFKHYFHETDNENSLLGNKILALDGDSQGRVWAMTAQGLSMIDVKTETIETFKDSLFQSRASIMPSYAGMVIDQRDKIWIMGAGVVFDIPSKEFQAPPKLPIQKRQYFFEATGGNMLALCTDQEGLPDSLVRVGIFRLDPTDSGFEKLMDTTTFTKYFTFRQAGIDGNENIWVGGNNGSITECNIATKQFTYHKFPYGTVYHFFYSPDADFFWLSNKDGLVRYELNSVRKHQMILYGEDEGNPFSLSSSWISVSLEDRSGNLWVGTNENGLCRYSPSKRNFNNFKRVAFDSNSLPGNEVKALHYDQKDRLWVGTTQGLSLLEERSNKKFKTFLPAGKFGQNSQNISVSCMEEDTSSGQLFLAYWGGYPNMFNPNTRVFSSLPLVNSMNFPPFYMNDIFLKNGILYYSNYDGGLLCTYSIQEQKFTNYNWAGSYEEARKAGAFSPTAASVWVSDNLVWLGMDEEGTGLQTLDLSKGHTLIENYGQDSKVASKIKKVGTFSGFKVNTGDSTKIQNSVTHCIFEDSHKRLWIGTAGGLFWVKDRINGLFVKYGLKQGFPSETIFGILEDSKGQLWLSTGRGIIHFNPDTKQIMDTYDVQDGLPGNQFNPNACSKSSTGELAFGGNKGFTIFHPDSMVINEIKPNVVITSFEVNGIPQSIREGFIELAPNENNLAFSFAVLDLSNPQKNKYQYFLEGFDQTWCEPTLNYREKYTNLDYGKYAFRVRGSNNDGIWDEKGAAIFINIKAPFYYRAWFVIPISLLLLAIIYTFIKFRKKKLKRERDETRKKILYLQAQTNQAQLNSHFTSNVLYAIQGHIVRNNIQQAVSELANLGKLIRRFLDSSIASEIADKGLSQTGISLKEEIELLRLYIDFEHRQRPEKFDYEIHVDGSLETTSITLPPMMIQPFVENAIKHGFHHKTEKGHLLVSFTRNEDTIICVVQDDGVGREKAKELEAKYINPYKSRGYELAKQREKILSELGNKIVITPKENPNGGVIVTIKFTEL